MTDAEPRVGGVTSVSGVGPSRRVRPNVAREQIDLFERMVGQGRRAAIDPNLELVTTLTRDEIRQIEDHLPGGSTVADVLGRMIVYHPNDGSHHARHHSPAGSGHVDEDA